MLLQVSKKVNACYERASVCRMQAERAADDSARAAFRRIEASWVRLAHSFEQEERVDRILQTAPTVGPLVVPCPQTGRELNTGIETSYECIAVAGSKSITVDCAHCGGSHPVPLRDGFIRLETA